MPVPASSVRSSDASCSGPTRGRAQNARCFSFPEGFLFWFSGARRSAAPAGCRSVTPNDSPTNSPDEPNYLDRLVRLVYHPVGCYRRTFVLRRVQPNGRSPAQGPSWVGSLGVPTFHHCGNCLSLAVLAERRLLPQLLPKLRHHSAGSLGAHSTHRQSRGNGCIPGATEETGAHSIRTGPRSGGLR